MSAAGDALGLLEALTGDAPAGLWSAPGRVNLIGEHTDYNEGFVLPFAIPQRTHVALRPRDDGRIRVASTLADTPVEVDLTALPARFPAGRERVAGWARYPLGVAWALLRRSGADPAGLGGADLAFASDVPLGAGLSSSAALESATALALDELWELGLSRVDLAHVGRTAENEAVGAPTGIMDQMASLLGQADAATFLDCRSLEAASIPLGFETAGLDVMVIDTRVRHSHATGGYGERRAACERGAEAAGVAALRDLRVRDLPRLDGRIDEVTLRRVRHVVTENQRVLDTVRLLHADRVDAVALGRLLDASHASLRDDFEVSVPELDLAVEAARAGGAHGARMTGGGFGGAAIALVDRDAESSVRAAVSEAFTAAGHRAPELSVVRPAAGARRDG